MSNQSTNQPMLSKFGAGDLDELDLSLPEEGIGLEERRAVESYAKDATAGGWEFLSVSNDRISWWNPDGHGTYWIERKKAGWHGTHNGLDARPHYTDDLQEALDDAGEFLSNNPLEKDN